MPIPLELTNVRFRLTNVRFRSTAIQNRSGTQSHLFVDGRVASFSSVLPRARIRSRRRLGSPHLSSQVLLADPRLVYTGFQLSDENILSNNAIGQFDVCTGIGVQTASMPAAHALLLRPASHAQVSIPESPCSPFCTQTGHFARVAAEG